MITRQGLWLAKALGQEASRAKVTLENLFDQLASTQSKVLRVVVKAENVAGSAEKESAVTGEVLGVGPTNTEAPSVRNAAL